ncbi:MAG: hypothetical protein RSE94_22960, partial [Pseudomonas sp.]
PLGTAVGLEMFKMTSEVDYGAMVMAKGKYFLEGLQELQKRYPIIGDVDGLGLALRCVAQPQDALCAPAPALPADAPAATQHIGFASGNPTFTTY